MFHSLFVSQNAEIAGPLSEKEPMSAVIDDRIAACTTSTYPKASQGDAVHLLLLKLLPISYLVSLYLRVFISHVLPYSLYVC